MNVDPKIKPVDFPVWIFPFKQIPNNWGDLPKRTVGVGEPEKLVLEKVCTKCKDQKPYIHFCLLKNGSYDSWCKSCRNLAKKERRKRG